MSANAKYILYFILDFGLSFGGSASVIIYNYITPTNSLGYKISLSGIVLIIALLLTAKAIFEKTYQDKMNIYLQQLAATTDVAIKNEINKKIKEHGIKSNIYQRLMLLLPFAVVYIFTWLGIESLDTLQGTLGFILLSLGAGSVFNILKKPLINIRQIEKIKKKSNLEEINAENV